MQTWVPQTIFLFPNFKNTHSRSTISIQGCSSVICCKAWIHDSKSVNIIYLDVTESLICSETLMVTQTSAVNMDAESGNLMKRTVSDENKKQ